MNLPETCPFCGAGVGCGVAGSWVGFSCLTSIHVGQEVRRTQSRKCEVSERHRLLDRVAELEARVREAEESNTNALARLSAAEARIELSRLENNAVRNQVWHAENACDAMEKLVLELMARCKRLEEAGDAIVDEYMVVEPEKSAWREAKEAKP